jgi:hypothetical protein
LESAGPTWCQRYGSALVASRRFDWSRSRKTKGSLADTLQCNIWRRAQSPHRMTHSLHGGGNHGDLNGFTALGKSIGTPDLTDKGSAYVTEHPVLKYFRAKLANFLNDFRSANWFDRLGLPVSNGRHNQLSSSQVRRLMLRVEQRAGPQGGGRCCERPEVQVFSRLDIGHKDFIGEQFVNCRPFWSRAIRRICKGSSAQVSLQVGNSKLCSGSHHDDYDAAIRRPWL